MTIQEKVEANEKSIKEQLETLRNTLNDLSKAYKKNPTDWQYLTALSYSNNALVELNKQLTEFGKDKVEQLLD
jgi:hypothetical protein